MLNSSSPTPLPDWETLRQHLRHPEALIRQETVAAVIDQRLPLADTLLLESLSDSNALVRQMAVGGLVELMRDETLEVLAEKLRLEDPAARSAAMSLLASLGARALPVLLPRLADPDADVRIFVANVLGNLGERAATEPLLTALTDSHENVRYAAAEALGKLKDPRATRALLQAMRDDEWVRFAAIEALGLIADPVAVEPLTVLLEGEPWLRLPAIEALGHMGDAATGAVLRRYLDDNQMVNHAVIAALGAIDERHGTRFLAELNQPTLQHTLVEALTSTYPAVRRSATLALGWVGDAETLPTLLQRLSDETEEVRLAARQSLIQFGERPPARAALIEIFHDVHSDYRLSLVEALSYSKQADAIDTLCLGLTDASAPVRVACAEGLGHTRHPRAIVPLIECLNDPEAEVRRAGVSALRQTPSAKAIPKLLRLLEDPAPDVRAEVAITLADFARLPSGALPEVDPSDIVNQITPLAQHAQADTREAALQALGRLPDLKATEALLTALNHPEASTRRMAVQALAWAKHTSPEVLTALTETLLDEDWPVRKQAVETLGTFDFERVAPAVRQALHDDNMWVRYAAARLLGERQDQVALPRLIELLQQDTDPVKLAAASAVGQLGARQAVPVLLTLAQNADPDLRRAAVEALGQLSAPEAKAALTRLLHDPVPSVRQSARSALDQLSRNPDTRPESEPVAR